MRSASPILTVVIVASCNTPTRSEVARALVAPNPQLAASTMEDLDLAGSFRTSIPIPVPAFHDLEPVLKLGYDSSAGDGIAGPGWTIQGISSITLANDKGGAPSFDAARDTYLLDGMELVPCSLANVKNASCSEGGTHVTRTESFVRVEKEGDAWLVTSKEGTISTYTAETIANSLGPTRWALSRVADRHGNVVHYDSWCDATYDCYPSAIRYGSTSAALETRVTFIYEDREDVGSRATGEGLRWTRKRLKTIDIFNAGARWRTFALRYERPADSGASTLVSFTEFDRFATVDTTGNVTGSSLPSRTFARAPIPSAQWGLDETTIPNVLAPLSITQSVAWNADPMVGSTLQRKTLTGDFDGDGHADSIVIDFGATPVVATVVRARPLGWDAVPKSITTPWPLNGRPMVVDANGDGRDDLFVVGNNPTTNTEWLWVALGRADGTFDQPTGDNLGINRHTSVYLQGDVGGDGRADLIVIERTLQLTSLDIVRVFSRTAAGTLVETVLATNLSSRGDLDVDLDPQAVPDSRLPDPMWFPGDVNGDGRTDLFRIEAVPGTPGSHAEKLRVRSFVASDFGFEQTSTLPGIGWSFPWSRRTHDRVHVGDFNGDGRTDLVFTNVFVGAGTPATLVLHTMMGRGDGTFDVRLHDTGMGPALLSAAGEGLPSLHPFAVTWMTGDVDGDRATDLVLAMPPADKLEMSKWGTFGTTVDLIEFVSDRRGKFTGRVRRNTPWRFDARLTCGVDINGNTICTRHMDGLLFDIALTDIDGDERADVLYTAPGTSILNLRVDVSPNNYEDRHRWTSTDITGDGRKDLVYPVFTGSALRINSSIDTGTIARHSVAEDVLPVWSSADAGNWIFADVGDKGGEADGRADLVYILGNTTLPSQGVRAHVLLSLGDGHWSTVVTPLAGSFDRVSDWRPLDVDADGDTDLVDVWRTPSGVLVVTLVSDGSGGFTRVDSPAFAGLPAFDPIDFKACDLDGDGRGDLISLTSPSSNAPPVSRALVSVGPGKWIASTHTAGTANAFATPKTVSFGDDVSSFLPVDVNGDGKSDLVRPSVPDLFSRYLLSGDVQVVQLLSRGDGSFTSAEAWSTLAAGATRREVAAQGWRVGDVNDDGRMDLVQPYAYDSPQTLDDKLTISSLRNHHDGGFVGERQTGLLFDRRDTTNLVMDDWMSDGRDGLSYVSNSGGGFVLTHVKSWHAAPRMTAIRNGLGKTRSITYASSAGAHTRMPLGLTLRVVSRIHDEVLPAGQTAAANIQYEGARYDFRERAFVGFAKTRAADDSTYVETQHAQTVACPDSATTVTTGGTGGAIRRERMTYEDNSAAGKLPWRCVPTTRSIDELDYGATARTYRVRFETDVWGNREVEHDDGLFVDANTDGVDDHPIDNRVTRQTFVTGSNFMVGFPSTIRIESSTGTRLSETRFGYDLQAVGLAPLKGDLTQRERWDSTTNKWVIAKASFDARGNRTRTEDETQRFVTYTFDPVVQRHVIAVCDALNCRASTYDYVLGLATDHFDPNFAHTTQTYDGFGRAKRTTFPDGGCLEWAYLETGDPGRQRIESYRCTRPNQVFDGFAGALARAGYYDGAERVYREKRTGVFEREMSYVGLTRLLASQTAWHDTGTAGRAETYTYDQGRRQISVTHADGSVRETRFSVGDDAHIDELGHVKHLRRDVRGMLVEIEENVTIGGKPTPLITRFTIDPLGRRTQTEDAAGNKSTRTWSSLDRELTACDPDRGCTTMTYLANGLLETRKDANGELFTYDYDASGRLTKRQDKAGAIVRYTYDRDPATNAPRGASLGRLVRVDDPSGSELYTYNVRGRRTAIEKCITGKCIDWAQAFDVVDRVETTSYPDAQGHVSAGSEVVTYRYDAAGRMDRVSSPVAIYADELVHDAEDRLAFARTGNGVETTFDFAPKRGRLEKLAVAGTGGTLFEATYEYDDANRIIGMTWNDSKAWALIAGHDELGRLTSVTGALASTYEYDAIGNLTYSSAVGKYAYDDTDHVHAVSSTKAGTYRYDAMGNLLEGGGRELTWSSDGLATKIVTGSGTTSMAYDAAGARVEKTAAGNTTRYFGDSVELTAKGDIVRHYHAGSSLLATRDPAGVRWYHTDRLGSVRLTTDAAGKVVQRFGYEPFGSESTTTVAGAAFGYAGHRGDPETGLVYMKARFYDPVLARFVSADSIVPDELDPQTLNRYSYANNAPFDRVDPDGHAAACPQGHTCTRAKRLEPEPPPPNFMIQRWSWQNNLGSFSATKDTLVQRGRDTVTYPNGRGYGKPFTYVVVCPSCHYERSAQAGDVSAEMTREDQEQLAAALQSFLNLIAPPLVGLISYALVKDGDVVVEDPSDVSTSTVSDDDMELLFRTLEAIEVDASTVPEGGRGRHGSYLTRAQNGAISRVLEANGWTIVGGGNTGMSEMRAPGEGGGNKGSVWFDTSATKPGRPLLHVQTVDTYADGSLTTREAANENRGNALTGKNVRVMSISKQVR